MISLKKKSHNFAQTLFVLKRLLLPFLELTQRQEHAVLSEGNETMNIKEL